MTSLVGHILLLAALVAAMGQCWLPFAPSRWDEKLLPVGKGLAHAQAALMLAAFGWLIYAFAVSDFSILNVFQNSHTAKPLLYKISGAWGNHEGSILMWTAMIACFGAALHVQKAGMDDPYRLRLIAIYGALNSGFIIYLIFLSNPFTPLSPVPGEGEGLNPLLQDIGLAMHPPMLYLGYTAFSVVFAHALAALAGGSVTRDWAKIQQPWVGFAWTVLTAGIALGSHWAYRELGWGGWWFWDPVENASLLPWLAGTALLHSLRVVEQGRGLVVWTLLLSLLAFSMSMLGTFLVRSGLLTSVHAFVSDPDRGLYILLFLVLVVGASLLLYAMKAPGLKGTASIGGLFSREGFILLNNLLTMTMAGTVLLGTVYPLALQAMGAPAVSVGPPYYHLTFVPFALIAVALAGLGGWLAWGGGKRWNRSLTLAALFSGLSAFAVAAFTGFEQALTLAAGFGLSAWLVLATVLRGWRYVSVRPAGSNAGEALLRLPPAVKGMLAAHLGLALLAAGATGMSLLKNDREAVLSPGENIAIESPFSDESFTAQYRRYEDGRGPNYMFRRAEMMLMQGDREIALLLPEYRFYPVEMQQTTEAAVHVTPLQDIYVALGEIQPDGVISVHIYCHPMISWIWLGASLLVVGGILGLQRREA